MNLEFNSQIKGLNKNLQEDNNEKKIIENKITKDQIFELRFNQSDASKLAEYITGIRPDDPRMLERIITDQKKLRFKYKLPTLESRAKYPENEYELILQNMAKENNTVIRSKDEHVRFFDTYKMANAIYNDEIHSIFIDIKRGSKNDYGKSLVTLEHELIHSYQEINENRMPIELREYEAYVSTMNMPKFKEMPGEIEFILFSFCIGVSTNIWYQQNKDNGKGPLEPVWRNPEYFLKNIDGFSDEDIKTYKNSRS